MTVPQVLFDYLATLAIIQPARIQDIESFAPKLLPHSHTVQDVEAGLFRAAHDAARKLKYVTTVRRGSYFLSPSGRDLVRRSSLHKEIDNMRLFLMKDQRKRYR